MAAFSPSWASETTSLTPRRPRRASLRRKSVQKVSASDAPIARPSTSRLPSPLTPTAMITATEMIRPSRRAFTVERRQRLRQSCPGTGYPASSAVEQREWSPALRVKRGAFVKQSLQFGGAFRGTYRDLANEPTVDVPRQKPGGLDIQESEKNHRSRTDQSEKQQREPEARGARDVTQSDGGHIPSPERCGSSATARLPRACGATGQRGHRSHWSACRNDSPRPPRTASCE